MIIAADIRESDSTESSESVCYSLCGEVLFTYLGFKPKEEKKDKSSQKETKDGS